jgi:protein-disulfide isomerase
VLEIIRNNPDVRFVFKEMPIFGGASDRAAMAALLVRRANGDSLGLYQSYMSARDLDQAGIDRIAAAHGAQVRLLDDPQFIREATTHLTENAAIAQEIGIQGTPGFVIGDTIIYGEDAEAINEAIAAQRRGGAPPAAAPPRKG